MSTHPSAYQRIFTWLKAAPSGIAKQIADQLENGSVLTKNEMNHLCTLAEAIGEAVVLVKITYKKGRLQFNCRDPNVTLDEFDYPDVNSIVEKLYENAKQPIQLYDNVPGLVAKGVLKEHFIPKRDQNFSTFTITNMFDVQVLVDLAEEQPPPSTPKRVKPAPTDPPPAPKRPRVMHRVLSI